MDPLLERLRVEGAASFTAERSVLSFDEYLALVRSRPRHHLRDATRYVLDAIEHFGVVERNTPAGTLKQHRAFDPEPDDPRIPGLVGQEAAQAEFVSALSGFAHHGRGHRLLLLLGPNGSAKSTFVAALIRAVELYSGTDEGALFKFSWVFPRERDGKAIGFGAPEEELRGSASFAQLPDDRLQARLEDELRQHPLLLLPRDVRVPLVNELGASDAVGDALLHGELGAKNQRVFESLLASYRGDLARVLAHVRVERFRISRRYRRGAVSIGPELGVDAAERAIAVDRSSQMLPASLAGATLYETHGELVDGQRGIVEYADLLERPLDAWKYLLLAVESGEVSLRASTLTLDALLVASSNDRHFDAFREHPAFASFRPRMVAIRLPYLLDHALEREIYEGYVVPRLPVAFGPHATFVAAAFAVLTRLRPARRESYVNPVLARAASSLRPMEKARLYAEGRAPERFDAEAIAALEAGVREVLDEHRTTDRYEGRTGVSPREIGDVLREAAGAARDGVVTAIDVLERLTQLCQRTDLEFLQQKPVDGYFDATSMLAEVRGAFLERFGHEIERASGLLDEAEAERHFARYVDHAVHWVKGEKVVDPRGRGEVPADEELMRGVEAALGVRQAEAHRRELLSTIAGYALDHPGEAIVPSIVFPRMLADLRAAYFAERRRALARLEDDVLVRLEGGEIADAQRRDEANRLADAMKQRFGYDPRSLAVALDARRAARKGDSWS